MLPEAAAPRDTAMVSIGGFCARDIAPPPDPRDGGRLTFMVGPRHQFGYSMMNDAQWGWWCHAHGDSEAERTRCSRCPPKSSGRTCSRGTRLERAGREPHRGDRGVATDAHPRRADLPTWHRGPVLLVGDAAHAMSPAGGQGASLALEDAMVLGKLAADPSRPIEDAMARFESLRRPRAEAMVAQAYANDRRTLKELGPLGMWTRDRVMMPLFAPSSRAP